jgi:hypothetical protein
MKMKLRILLLLILVSGLVGCGKFEKEILIPKSKIQSMVAKKFPYKKNAIIAKLNLHSPQVYFKDTNIGLKLNYYGNFLEKEINGLIDFNGQIFYRPEKGAFYIKNFQIVDIVVNEANFSDKQRLKSVVLKLVINYLEDYPVYRLNPTDFKQNIAKLLLKEVSVKDDSLSVLLST